MTDEFVPAECIVCGAVYGHDPDCGNQARSELARWRSGQLHEMLYDIINGWLISDDHERNYITVTPAAAREIAEEIVHQLRSDKAFDSATSPAREPADHEPLGMEYASESLPTVESPGPKRDRGRTRSGFLHGND